MNVPHLIWITNLGDAALTVPVAFACALWLSAADRREAFR